MGRSVRAMNISFEYQNVVILAIKCYMELPVHYDSFAGGDIAFFNTHTLAHSARLA
jgi:hypothetical protein